MCCLGRSCGQMFLINIVAADRRYHCDSITHKIYTEKMFKKNVIYDLCCPNKSGMGIEKGGRVVPGGR